MKYDDKHIIELLEIETLDEESKAQIIESVQATMNMRLAQRVTDELEEAQMEEFSQLVDTNPGGVQEWIISKVPGFDTVIDEVANGVIKDIKSSIK